jgi:hypothetical protein
MNLYQYCGNNGVNYNDPYGLCRKFLVLPVAGTLILTGEPTQIGKIILVTAGIIIISKGIYDNRETIFVGIATMAAEVRQTISDLIQRASGENKSKSANDAEKQPPESKADRNPKQDKKLSPQEIKKLKDAGVDPEVEKLGKGTGQRDLYKDPKTGNIYVKPKGGSGPGEPTGYNINDF